MRENENNNKNFVFLATKERKKRKKKNNNKKCCFSYIWNEREREKYSGEWIGEEWHWTHRDRNRTYRIIVKESSFSYLWFFIVKCFPVTIIVVVMMREREKERERERNGHWEKSIVKMLEKFYPLEMKSHKETTIANKNCLLQNIKHFSSATNSIVFEKRGRERESEQEDKRCDNTTVRDNASTRNRPTRRTDKGKEEKEENKKNSRVKWQEMNVGLVLSFW